jgi:hypothetical protein
MVRVFGAVSLGNPLVFLTIWSPTIFALGAAFTFDGREGLLELTRRIFRWRFWIRWYLVSTLGVALLAPGARFVRTAVTKTAAPHTPVFEFACWPSFVWFGVSMMILDPGPLGGRPWMARLRLTSNAQDIPSGKGSYIARHCMDSVASSSVAVFGYASE